MRGQTPLERGQPHMTATATPPLITSLARSVRTPKRRSQLWSRSLYLARHCAPQVCAAETGAAEISSRRHFRALVALVALWPSPASLARRPTRSVVITQAVWRCGWALLSWRCTGALLGGPERTQPLLRPRSEQAAASAAIWGRGCTAKQAYVHVWECVAETKRH